MKLTVYQVEADDVFEDLARLDSSHRPGIMAGEICKIEANGKRILVVARNARRNEKNAIWIDDAIRSRLEVKAGESYDFAISKATFWEDFWWAWQASNAVNRIAARLGLLGLVLGVVGLILGLLSLFLAL